MATPSKSRKPGAYRAPAVVKATPVQPAAEAIADPSPVIEPIITPEPVEVEGTDEGMVSDMAHEAIEPAIETPTPQVAESADPLPVVTAPATKGTTTMTDAMETAKGYAEEAKVQMQSAFTDLSAKAKSAVEKSSRAFEELGELTKGNLEAVVESSKIAAKGVETMSQEAAELGRKSFEKTSATMKSFASIKTPTEFFQLQSELLSSVMDSFASASAKNSEAMLKLASDISQPISNRVSIVTEKMKSLAA